jgi:tetratricopeptide (TPR) repeat protein
MPAQQQIPQQQASQQQMPQQQIPQQQMPQQQMPQQQMPQQQIPQQQMPQQQMPQQQMPQQEQQHFQQPPQQQSQFQQPSQQQVPHQQQQPQFQQPPQQQRPQFQQPQQFQQSPFQHPHDQSPNPQSRHPELQQPDPDEQPAAIWPAPPHSDLPYVHPAEETRRSGANMPPVERRTEMGAEPLNPEQYPESGRSQRRDFPTMDAWPREKPDAVSAHIPHVVAPPLDPAEARNLVDQVRATAWRVASRVAYEAQNRMEGQRQVNTQKLRIAESAAQTETQKLRHRLWPPDPATIGFFVVVILGILIVVGLVFLVHSAEGTRPYVTTGKRYQSENKDEMAIGQFTLAIEKNPADVEALELRAQTFEKMKDLEHASADYAQLWELRPKMQSAARKAAFLAFKLKQYDSSVKLSRKMLAAHPDDESAKAQLIMNMARGGKYQDAITESAQVDNDLVPASLAPDYFGSVGYAWLKMSDMPKAIAHYSKALKADPNHESNLVERASAYMQAKDYKHAAADYQSLTTLFPARAGGYADYAKASYLAGDVKTAADQYEKAMKFSPNLQFCLALAECDMALGRYGHAVSDCDTALKIQPTSFEAAHLRTVALTKAKSEKAIVTATITQDPVAQIIARRPAPAAIAAPTVIPGQDPLTTKAYGMLVQKNWNGALQILPTAIKRSPRDWSARRFYAAACMEVGRDREAFDVFTFMSANNALLPTDELAYAEAAKKSGHNDRAIEIYIHALDRDPSYLQVRVDLIKLCVAQGYNDKAAQFAAQGMALSPASKDILKQALGGDKAKN